MKSLLFGPAGIPNSTPDRNTVNGIKHVKKLGLGSMELEFVRSINISEKLAPQVKKTAEDEGIILTCHGQYWVNLNASDNDTLEKSKKRVLDACRRASDAGVWSICYHAAYNMGMEPKKVYENVLKVMKELSGQLKSEGNKIWLRPETAGKLSQFGDLKQMIDLSMELDNVLPCIDFAHHHARTNGKCSSYEKFAEILEEIEKKLGKEALHNMHCHAEGIEYSEKGERNHLNLKESDFNYKALMKALKDFGAKGVVTCESPNIEEDALLMKKCYDGL